LTRRAGYVLLAVLCVTTMLATAASATSVAPKKPKPGGGSSSVKTIANSLKAEEKATFSVTYMLVTSSLKGTYSYAQKPPDYRLAFQEKAGSFVFIQIGKTAYECYNVSGHALCYHEKSNSSISGELGFFQPGLVAPEVAALESGAKGVTTFSKTFSGQASTCVSATYNGEKVTYCVTDKGVLAYSAVKGVSVTLVGFSSSPPASDFVVPSGTTIK
jgi:hypothetical protein